MVLAIGAVSAGYPEAHVKAGFVERLGLPVSLQLVLKLIDLLLVFTNFRF